METFFDIYVFIFGLLIGSFLNVVILRLPEKKDLVYTRSPVLPVGASLSGIIIFLFSVFWL